MNFKKIVDLYRRIFITLICLSTILFISATPIFAQRKEHTSEPATSPKCNQFTFDATKSTDPDNEKISYFWDFGDGKTSTEPVVTHTYEKSGDYKVTLSVTDNSGLECGTAVTSQVVRVNIPPYSSFASEENVCANTEIPMDASASYDDSQGELGYEWNFGDGTRSAGEKKVAKKYEKAGEYRATLTVDDNSGTVCSKQSTEKTIYVNEPPIAEAGEDVILKCVSEDSDMVVSFDASASSDANGDELQYVWDFGDGNKADGVQVSHKYSSIGNYDVKLIVKDNTNMGCGTGVDIATVKLNTAPTASAGEDLTTCINENIIFDGSSSYGENKKGTLTFDWIFGDGQKDSGFKVSHTYKKPGTYQAILSVENKLNPMCSTAKDTRTITVNTYPTVDLKTVNSTCLGNIVNFDASSATDLDGDQLEYYWSFGDGTILKSGSKVSHEYQQGGNYKVTVIVDDTKGTACSTATALSDIKINTPPVVNIGSNKACCVGIEAEFNASASSDPDGDILSYTWDFGDGTKSNSPIIKHAYAKSGTYTVKLTVDDASGTSCAQATDSFAAQINASPVPVMTIK